MNPQLHIAEVAAGELLPARSIYVHFPWCRHRCAYCDFATTAAKAIPRQRYLAAVCADLDRRAALLEPVETIFFGGGTPSLWGAAAIGGVLEHVAATVGIDSDAEITLEANPGASGPAALRALADAGVNRISIGVQALDDGRLRRLDRIHDANHARLAVAEIGRLLASGALRSASADLLLGGPGQTMADLRGELKELLDAGLPHLSTYTLTVEAGTPLAQQVAAGRAPAPDEGIQTDMLLALPDLVAPWGLARYEVSNLARPGHESRHNLACWRGEPYVALGAAGHGFIRSRPGGEPIGWRWANVAHAGDYQRAMASGQDGVQWREPISAAMHLDERVLTGLRLTEGLDLSRLRADLPEALCDDLLARIAAALAADAPLVHDGDRLRVAAGGLRRLDGLIVDLLA